MNNDPLKEREMNEQTKNEPFDREATVSNPVPEIGGAPGPEPTRYGDWEKKGRCIDF